MTAMDWMNWAPLGCIYTRNCIVVSNLKDNQLNEYKSLCRVRGARMDVPHSASDHGYGVLLGVFE